MARTTNNTKAVAAQVKPVANNAAAAASRGLHKARTWAAPQVERTGQVLQENIAPATRRGVHKARAWAAPQVDRTGQVLQDTVAPKVAAALHSSAQRLDPGKPKRTGWRIAIGISALVALAAAVAAGLRKRSTPTAPAEEEEPAPPLAEQAKANAAHTS